MKRAMAHIACIIGLAIGPLTTTAFAATTANGPYYATPSWDQTLPASTRFIVLSNFNNQAVLDRETGLVWEQSPDSTGRIWEDAQIHCNRSKLGGRKGWRLPTVQDLASLVDPTVFFPGPVLPPGHPFSNVSSIYFSATTDASDATSAWVVVFDDGFVDKISKAQTLFVWCVRGGQGPDAQ
jgi:hypothetical protein